MNKILLIGCGHMGSALLKSWSSNTNFSFIVVDPNQYKGINKKFKTKVQAYKSIYEVKDSKKIDIVIFAVKPQVIEDVMKDFKNFNFKTKAIFMSIIAGKKINFFKKYILKPSQFIRVMPNMPSLINQGMTCLFADKKVSNKNKKIVDKMFLNLGQTLWLKKESDINKVTAISGSGPGYVFLLIDAFEKAAIKLKLGEKETKKLIHQTFLGSILLLLKEKKPSSLLANNIAIKGGTTEAGLKQFKNKKILHDIFNKVVKAAYKKSIQLGK